MALLGTFLCCNKVKQKYFKTFFLKLKFERCNYSLAFGKL